MSDTSEEETGDRTVQLSGRVSMRLHLGPELELPIRDNKRTPLLFVSDDCEELSVLHMVNDGGYVADWSTSLPCKLTLERP